MVTPLARLIRILLALGAAAAALTAVSLPARAGGGRGAIAAGVAGGVAGVIAGQALQGALPPPGYAAPPPQNCWWEQRQERGPYSFHIGQVRVCE